MLHFKEGMRMRDLNTTLLLFRVKNTYEGGSESSVIGVITLLIYMIGCCIIPCLKGLHFSFIMMPKQCTNEINTSKYMP